jgi:hypothetical protein
MSAPTKPEEPRVTKPESQKTDQAPKPSLEQIFVNRLAAIFAGQRTPEAELFEPLERLDSRKHEIIGVITDPKTRELFSLAQLLEEEQKSIRLARKPGEILEQHV